MIPISRDTNLAVVVADFNRLSGAPNCDEVFFALDEVFTAGQPIGMILADSAKRAEAGARAVKVDYEAILHESYFDHYRYIKKGDTKNAFETADHVFSGVARMGGQEHFYLETSKLSIYCVHDSW